MAQQPSDEVAPAAGSAGEKRTAGNARRGRQTIARLADELLPTLIARLEQSSIGELEVRQDGWRVRLRRASDNQPAAPARSATRSATQRRGERGARPAADRAAHEDPPGSRPQSLRAERERRVVTSPAVGYYLPRSGVVPGAHVRAGDVIGHVDVLGVRQDVAIPEDGVLVSLAAESGEAVEYGQVLARLDPGRAEAGGASAEAEHEPVDAAGTADGAPIVNAALTAGVPVAIEIQSAVMAEREDRA